MIERVGSRGRDEAVFLVCPRCRLSIPSGARGVTGTPCPRCSARAGVAVELFCSRLPASELYGELSTRHEHMLPNAR